jgi:cell fate regulator YaaT (PSP1 superfamily)
MVETEHGLLLGQIVSLHDSLPDGNICSEITVLRAATDADKAAAKANDELVRRARRFCQDSIRNRELDMKLVDVEVYFDASKMIFYFTAPARIDFRELLKDLVREYRARIELRQIGVRHETQMIGAIGNCGMVCCCRRFLRKFAPVTIRMAKEQNLFLNPAKISGICGRLLCCLSYEQENYDAFHRECPRLGKKYQTSQGAMKVLRANMFRNSLSVLNELNEEQEITLEEWRALTPRRTEQTQQTGPEQQENQRSDPAGL